MIDLFFKGGILMYPILLGSIVGGAIWIEKFIQYRRILKKLDLPVEDILETCPLPASLAPIVAGLENNCDEKAISVIGTKQIRRIENGLSWLALIATIEPLLGLTGTVTGMIKAFIVVEKSASVSPPMLAGGIWEALITTAAGLLVAIPLQIGHHYLENRADEIAFLLKEITSKLIQRERNGI